MIKHKRIINYLLSFLPIFMLLNLPVDALAATREYQLKAAFLIQFVKYTHWKNISGDQIVIGIIGEDTFGDALEKYQGKRLQGKKLVIINVDTINEAVSCCQLLFISVSENNRIDGIIKALSGDRLPVYGTGDNVRDWLYVEDHARALLAILQAGRLGESYNVGGEAERTNIDVVRNVCAILDEFVPGRTPRADLIDFVSDRPGHDTRPRAVNIAATSSRP